MTTTKPGAAGPGTTLPTRLAALDGMRAVAALAILLTHFGFFTGTNFNGGIGDYLARLDVGMSIFFVISGFAIYRPFVERSLNSESGEGESGTASFGWGQTLAYFRSRALRILPLYWAALAVAVWLATDRYDLGLLISSATLTQIYTPSALPPLLEQSWSLCVEVSFYLAVPFLAMLAHRLRTGTTRASKLAGHVRMLAILVVTATVWRLVMAAVAIDSDFQVFNWLPNFLDQFALGMGAAVYMAWRKSGGDAWSLPSRFGYASWTVAGVAFIAASKFAGLPTDTIFYSAPEHIIRHLLYTVVAGGLVVPLALGWQQKRSPSALLASRPLQWLGLLSYGIYIWQNIAFELIVRRYPATWRLGEIGFFTGPARPLLLWSVVLTLALSLAAFVCLEWPTLRYMGSSSLRQIQSWFWWGLAGITSGAFLVRFASLATVAARNPDGGDPWYYHIQANMVADGLGYNDPFRWVENGRLEASAIHPPGYTTYLAIFSKLGARDFFDHKAASVLLGTAAVFVIGLIAWRLGGRAAGLVAASFAALYPNLWLLDGVLMPEGFFILCVGIMIYACYRWRVTTSWWLVALIGLMVGYGGLIRGEGLILGASLVAPWMLLNSDIEWKKRLGSLALAGAVAVSVVAPWMIRNSREFEVFVPLSTNSMEVMVYSNCDSAWTGEFAGHWDYHCQQDIRDVQGEFPGDEADRAKAWEEIGLAYRSNNWSTYPKVLATRALRQWELYRPIQNTKLAAIFGPNQTWNLWGLWFYTAMVPLAAVGLWWAHKNKVRTWPLLAQVATVTFTALYAYASTRFRAPAEIALIVLASLGVRSILCRFRSTQKVKR